jgi:hypothetical protein
MSLQPHKPLLEVLQKTLSDLMRRTDVNWKDPDVAALKRILERKISQLEAHSSKTLD